MVGRLWPFPNTYYARSPVWGKGCPSGKAEFGHPDVTITLTCLSCYDGGLSEEQLKPSSEMLLKQHDPSLDYSLGLVTALQCRNLCGLSAPSISSQWSNLEQVFIPTVLAKSGNG